MKKDKGEHGNMSTFKKTKQGTKSNIREAAVILK